MWNLVGFQTRLRIAGAAARVPDDPGPRRAPSSCATGPIHRNAYLNAPGAPLAAPRAPRRRRRRCSPGQLTGVEGYTESLGTGLLAGLNLARLLRGREPLVPPPTTMLGGAAAPTSATPTPAHFQPMNANFGLLRAAGAAAAGPGAQEGGAGGAGARGDAGRSRGRSRREAGGRRTSCGYLPRSGTTRRTR